MIMPRDEELFGLISKFKMLNTNQIHKLLFSNVSETYCRHRLKQLADAKEIKRERYHIDQEYVYWMGKKPEQPIHRIKFVDLWMALGKPEAVAVQKKFGTIIPDGYVEMMRNGKGYSFFVEIHRFNGFDFDKYLSFDYRKCFVKMPTVIIVTDKALKIPESNIRFVLVKNDMSNICEVF